MVLASYQLDDDAMHRSAADSSHTSPADSHSHTHGRSGHSGAMLFPEPSRWLGEDPGSVPLPATVAAEWAWFPFPRLIRSIFRIRNTLAVYNFFTIYCVNAVLNLEIWREYMTSAPDPQTGRVNGGFAPSKNSFREQMQSRNMLENLYVLSLLSPLIDVLARVLARNFFKLNLAKAMTHAGFTSSLAICTPSLNTYALLILRGHSYWIIFILFMDLLEVLYSAFMVIAMQHSAGDLTEAMGIKIFFIAFSAAMFIWDAVVLFQLRRFFGKLPRQIHPVFVCWDANQCFTWHSPNSILDIMELHENLAGPVWTNPELTRVRRKIAEFNEDEQEISTIEQAVEPDGGVAEGGNAAAAKRVVLHGAPRSNASSRAPSDDEESEVERKSLLAARR